MTNPINLPDPEEVSDEYLADIYEQVLKVIANCQEMKLMVEEEVNRRLVERGENPFYNQGATKP